MKIILTSAIIKDFYEERKDEYQKSIDFFENTDSISKSAGEGYAHREASEWHRGGEAAKY